MGMITKREVNETPRKKRMWYPVPVQSNSLGEDMTVAHWKVCVGFAQRLKVTSTRSHLLLV